MKRFTSTIRRPARSGLAAALGVFAILAAASAGAQETKSVLRETRPKPATRPGGGASAPARTEEAGARHDARADRNAKAKADDDDLDPDQAEALANARERVEVLEAQLIAKRAHIAVADARLKQAQEQLAFLRTQSEGGTSNQEKIAMLQAEIPVLDAEHDAEYAEIREPEVLLKHARKKLDELEKQARRPGLAARMQRTPAYPGMESMGMGYPMMNMGYPMMGMVPPMMGMGRAPRESDQIDDLRDVIEALRRDIEGLKRASRP